MAQNMNIGEICNRFTVFAYEHMSVSEAARLMLEQHVGSLVVIEETDQGRSIAGMLTDRDIVLAVVAPEFDAQTTRVADIMSKDLVSCRAEDTMTDALELMRHHGVRRLPVTEGAQNTLAGIVTLDDLLEILAEEMQSVVGIVKNERKREEHLRR